MTETDIVKRIMLRASQLGHTVFRCNTGMGWAGKLITKTQQAGMMFVPAGAVVLADARPLRAGLCQGGSDIIGWTYTGKFLAVEGKDKMQASKDQLNFIDQVNKAGGIAGIARSPEDLEQILMDHGC
jgi:hypothetical protein